MSLAHLLNTPNLPLAVIAPTVRKKGSELYMSTKPIIVFLVPVDTLTDESISALHTALEKAAEIMKMFAQYDTKVQSCEMIGLPLCSVCIKEQLDLNLTPQTHNNEKMH